MKVAMMSIAMMLLVACTAHALPVEPDAISSVDEVHPVAPAHPRVQDDDAAEEETQLMRDRRSPGGWQQGGNGGGFPRPQTQPQQPRGSITGGVQREKGVGTIVHGQGQGNVWTSKDGNSRVDAQGQWSKVVRGTARGKPNYSGGVTYSHKWK